ncbi:Carbon storage regulator [Stieleria neptunia]|uniref:Translational regulator CsrA n=1 Tax=Stieleria neptunia TaxID=2527979 RepID=A0A518HWG9_9BACT|nr:carbon storage regulator [Stieleria neptunia]QDV45195.1 Carbon storage regulator [Stieleria neptunia]
MLVLSRKVDQQIKIGDDVTVTVVRVEGNRVRIGISAPRDVRILRGELDAEQAVNGEVEFELSEREFAFAHQNASDRIRSTRSRTGDSAQPQVFSGSVTADGGKVKLVSDSSSRNGKSAPLASFVSAS